MNKALVAAAIAAFAASLIAAATVFLQDSQQEAAATEEFFNYTAYFCPEQDCLQAFASQLKSAMAAISCALYSIDDSLLSDLASFHNLTAAKTAIEIVVDKNSKVAEKFLNGSSGSGFVFRRSSRGIMHNKYCILDNARVITGSFNPTLAAKNDYNNLLIINSTSLAAFYRSDFEKLKQGNSEKTPAAAAVASRNAKKKAAMLNSTLVEVYFCPQDGCADAVEKELEKATSSIIFAAYSFTSAEIANELILKKSEGIAVAGVIEKSTAGSAYSKHNALAANGIPLLLESTKKLMHHKFFVIDNKTVITGSFNPTKSADERNNENIIIIRSREAAAKYAEEFNKIHGETYAQK